MAKGEAFWGIDIGQSALKALKCRAADSPDKIEAEAFDFIEYPKILSQPDADPVELIKDALEEFLKRNQVKGTRVAISVPGDRGLPRFVKLPPVESSKIPDLVKFEARQQIPFPLEDVVWDFQQMPGGTEEDGFSMETEVGLFAMKRDQVFRSLRPFTNAGIEVDIVQLTPISLFNYVVFDQMQDLPPPENFNPEDPPESLIVMSLGTDTSDLVVTNGYRVWQRSIPIGGNHFTKAITKDLKVTFSKAEHLKRNAMKAEDPRAIFQAMRPVFNELVTEVQRSLNFFNSINRTAKLGKILALGNTMKLRGLQKYLAQNLGMDVETVEDFRGLTGSGVVKSPAFQENLASFGVSYGLCIQGLNRGVLSTNLLPGEILQAREIRAKKPWAVAAAALLLVGCGFSYAGAWRMYKTADLAPYQQVFGQVKDVAQKSKTELEEFTALQESYKTVDNLGQSMAQIAERQMLWPVLVHAVQQCLPQAGKTPEEIIAQSPEVGKRDVISIGSVDCEMVPDLAVWFTGVKSKYESQHPNLKKTTAPAADAAQAEAVPPADASAAAPPADPNAPPPADASAEAPAYGPKGKGYVIELRGHHYHNNDSSADSGVQYLQKTFIRNLENKKIKIKNLDGKEETVTLKELGVDFPVIYDQTSIESVMIPNPYAASVNATSAVVPKPPGAAPMTPGNAAQPMPPMATAAEIIPEIPAKKFSFVLQFAWTPQTETQRAAERVRVEKERIAKEEQEKAAAANNASTEETN
ncbi:MAG: type IV pilus assembly protein PilM [Pirellulales bacterium]|nr:type IV pilus assembly protein PilM [Pirellulales bacterium]